jgi:hypothetical protein
MKCVTRDNLGVNVRYYEYRTWIYLSLPYVLNAAAH